MGCAPSAMKEHRREKVKRRIGRKNRMSSVTPWVAVFVPSLWLPVRVDIPRLLKGLAPGVVVEKMSHLRERIVTLAEHPLIFVAWEMRQLLEEYLPMLLGLTMKGHHLETLVEFKWKNPECDGQEVCLSSAWFEVLFVVHLMAMLCLLEANAILLCGSGSKSCEVNISEESMNTSVHLLLRAAGYLDYCVQNILVHLHLEVRRRLPNDLQDVVLEAISIQAWGQALEIQLGLMAENAIATSSIKRRLACEEACCYAQALYCLSGATDDAYGRKRLLFAKWKFLEAKAAAYYYNGVLLDASYEPNSHVNAANSFLAADELLRKSKMASLSFCMAGHVTRIPPRWGIIKDLCTRIPEVASQKYQMYGYLLEQESDLHSLPDLPEYPFSLQSETYELPDIDTSWNDEIFQPGRLSLREHLDDDDEEAQEKRVVG